MRAAAIFGLGCSVRDLRPFQSDKAIAATNIEWRIGMPSASDQVDAVLVFGGDGTIHRHLGQLVKLGRPVLVVPAGSGNDFARGLGLGSVRDSLAAWRKFCLGAADVGVADVGTTDVRTIDLGVITPLDSTSPRLRHGQCRARSAASTGTRYFCCVAGLGLDGEVARRAIVCRAGCAGTAGTL